MTERDIERLRREYSIPNVVSIRITGHDEGAVAHNQNTEVCVLKGIFKVGVHFSLLPVIQELLCELRLAPIQILPNGWRFVLACAIIWPMSLGKDSSLSTREFLSLYRPTKYGDAWTF